VGGSEAKKRPGSGLCFRHLFYGVFELPSPRNARKRDCTKSIKIGFGFFLGVQKHHVHIFATSPCRKLSPKKSTKTSMSVFPRLFCFVVFSGVSQRWEFKDTKQIVLKKTPYRKVFTKQNRPEVQNHFVLFFLSRFWAFLGGGSSKTR
jgi:hypothetical protein